MSEELKTDPAMAGLVGPTLKALINHNHKTRENLIQVKYMYYNSNVVLIVLCTRYHLVSYH